jgi:hypothetical protein
MPKLPKIAGIEKAGLTAFLLLAIFGVFGDFGNSDLPIPRSPDEGIAPLVTPLFLYNPGTSS